MKVWLVIGTEGAMKIVENEDTASGAAYAAADRYGMASPQMTVYPLGKPESFNRGWVKEFVPNNS